MTRSRFERRSKENQVSLKLHGQKGRRDENARNIVGHQVEVIEVGSVCREVVQGRSAVVAEEAARRDRGGNELGRADSAAESLEEEEEVGRVGGGDGVAA